MAITSESTTIWTGTLFDGSGNVALDSSGLATFDVNWDARAVGVANTTNPEDRKSGRERVGYYDKATKRLAVLTDDELFILSHYRPTRGEAYVRGLLRSTYT